MCNDDSEEFPLEVIFASTLSLLSLLFIFIFIYFFKFSCPENKPNNDLQASNIDIDDVESIAEANNSSVYDNRDSRDLDSENNCNVK